MKIFSLHTIKTGLSIIAMGVFTIAAKSAGDRAADNWKKAKGDSELDDINEDDVIIEEEPEEEKKEEDED